MAKPLKDKLGIGIKTLKRMLEKRNISERKGMFEIKDWNFDKESPPRNADRRFNGTTLIKEGLLGDEEYSVDYIVRQGNYGGPKRRLPLLFALNPLGIHCSPKSSGKTITLDMSYQKFALLHNQGTKNFRCNYSII